MNKRAVFFDRDGTLIEDVGYVDDPAKVRLLPGAAQAIRRCKRAGYLVIIASNQSGIARGLFTEEVLAAVHRRLEALLAKEKASLDGAYYCPFLDGEQAAVEAYRRDSHLRKPKPGMLLQAAEELDIDLSASWMIGDAIRDVQAGVAAGCRAIALDPDNVFRRDELPENVRSVRSLPQAIDIILRSKAERSAGEEDAKIPASAQPSDSPPERTGDAPAESSTDAAEGESSPGVVLVKPPESGKRASPAPDQTSGQDSAEHSPPQERKTKADGGRGKTPPAQSPAPVSGQALPAELAEGVEQEASRKAAGESDHPAAGDTLRLLRRIDDKVDRLFRQGRQDDFSLLQLLASLAQMLALAAGAYACIALFSDDHGEAIPRFLLACFLQIVALTCHVMARLR